MTTGAHTILSEIEKTRRELLDSSMNNRLLNYRPLRARGVEIVEGDVGKVFQTLVDEGKSLPIVPRPEVRSSTLFAQEPGEAWPKNQGPGSARTQLQTDETSSDLDKRLINTYRVARTSLEESGVNIMFLAMGMLQWYESDASDDPRLAPLVLVPVRLVRAGATSRFRLEYDGEDLGVNQSLIEFLERDFRIQLPGQEELDPDDQQDLNVSNYIDKVERCIKQSGTTRWAVQRNRMALGFFSFHKLLMWKDLEDAIWQAAGAPIHTNQIIAALFGDGFQEGPSGIPDEDHLDESLPPAKTHHVLDADAYQSLAIYDAVSGRNMVIQGPPGTGKSQTIANILAEAVASGKRVLFVAEKMAALEVVKRRMDNAGLGQLCLELHSDKANKAQVLAELRNTMEGLNSRRERLEPSVQELEQARRRLNDYARRVNTSVGAGGVSPHDAIGQLLLLGETGPNPLRWQSLHGIRHWTADDFTQKRRQVEELRLRLGEVGVPNQHPFYGVGLRKWTPSIEQGLADNLMVAYRSIVALEEAAAALADLLPPMARPNTDAEAQTLLSMARLAEDAPDLRGLALAAPRWRNHPDQINRLLRNGLQWQEVRRNTDAVTEAAAALANKLPPVGPPKSADEAKELLGIALLAEDAPDLNGLALADPQWRTHPDRIGRLLQEGLRRQAIHAELDSVIQAEAWGAEFGETRRVLDTTGRRLLGRLFSFSYKRARRRLAQALKGPFPLDVDLQVHLLDAMAEEARLNASIMADGASVSEALGSRWSDLQTVWSLLEPSILWWLERATEASNEVIAVLQCAADQGGAPSLSRDLIPLCTKWAALETQEAQFTTAIVADGAACGEALAAHWAGLDTDWEALAPSIRWWTNHATRASDDFVNALQRRADNGAAPSLADSIATVSDRLKECALQYAKALAGFQWDKSSPFADLSSAASQPFFDRRAVLQRWTDHLPAMNPIVQFYAAGDHLLEAGIEAVVDLAETHPDAETSLTGWFNRTWYESILDTALTEHRELQTFNRNVHERAISSFRELDQRMVLYNRSRVAVAHRQGALPPQPLFGQGPPLNRQTADRSQQRQVLDRELQKKRRHKPIRGLLSEAGGVIQDLKPVFMMSPLSIAKFLAPGKLDFDIVVFDEASQVRPADSLGALLRGRKAVVVGDSKQLPPTTFFDRVSSDDDADDDTAVSATADLESILGFFVNKHAQPRALNFHYRSRHESLIAVSNREFYHNGLVVLPSPDAGKEETGLQYRYLPDTAYDRGGSSTNPKEAEAVAQAVMEHAKQHPQLSLGVVAFSQSQAKAIEDRVEAMRRQDPSAEEFFNAHPEEPFRVKNLENVQGDERDVILISIGYGKDANGRLSQNFGPLNKVGGERRLNVLITRAKQRCCVFTNLHATDIADPTGAGESLGPQALKVFLLYAETGEMPSTVDLTDREVDSPFQQAVSLQLSARGFQLRQEVGVGGYFIDIAIVDPERPGRYAIGIECDGASYHSSKTARDRDRIREGHLRSLGWELHRIWSTDWWHNPERELERCVDAINRSLRNL